MTRPKDTTVRVCRSDVAWLLDALALAPWHVSTANFARVVNIGKCCAMACLADVVYHDRKSVDVVSLSAYDLAEALAAVDPVWAYELPTRDAKTLRSHPAIIAVDVLTDEMRRQAPAVWDAVMSEVSGRATSEA